MRQRGEGGRAVVNVDGARLEKEARAMLGDQAARERRVRAVRAYLRSARV